MHTTLPRRIFSVDTSWRDRGAGGVVHIQDIVVRCHMPLAIQTFKLLETPSILPYVSAKNSISVLISRDPVFFTLPFLPSGCSSPRRSYNDRVQPLWLPRILIYRFPCRRYLPSLTVLLHPSLVIVSNITWSASLALAGAIRTLGPGLRIQICMTRGVKHLNKDGGRTQRKALVSTYTSYTELALSRIHS